jgi:1,4-dihydroxy-2-naphthoyl-CoA synthase
MPCAGPPRVWEKAVAQAAPGFAWHVCRDRRYGYLHHGLIFAATALDDLTPTAVDLARRLKALSPLTAKAKASVYMIESIDLASARRFEIEAVSLVIGSPDRRECMAAFIETREPKF